MHQQTFAEKKRAVPIAHPGVRGQELNQLFDIPLPLPWAGRACVAHLPLLDMVVRLREEIDQSAALPPLTHPSTMVVVEMRQYDIGDLFQGDPNVTQALT